MAIKGQCAICQHPRAAEITAAIAVIGHRPTARKFQVTYSAIDRHKRHLMLEQKLREENQTPRSSREAIELTPRQAKFVEGVVEGKTRRSAALAAGYSDSTARHAGVLMSRPAIREAFAELLPSAEKIAQRISEGLDATKVELVKHDGKITAREEFVDFTERRRYAELASMFRGLTPEPRSNVVQVGVQVNVGAEEPVESDLDLEVAKYVSELTNGFDESEISRLKKLLDSERPAVN